MKLILLFSLLWAHEDLKSTHCANKELEVSIQLQKDHSYVVTDLKTKDSRTFKRPIIADFWDESKKQIFDTYKFEDGDFKIAFKRPETKGPIKKTFAEYQGQILNCQQ
jgi:hypothetical protein